MIAAKTFCYRATIPMNICVILWVWIGRALFGVGGWWMVIFLFTVVPVLIVALLITTVLAIRQRVPAGAGFLTDGQFWWLCSTWLSLLLFGFFIVDAGDTQESMASAFTTMAGRSAIDASNYLSVLFFASSVVTYVVLLILLIIGQTGRWERKRASQQALSDTWDSRAAPGRWAGGEQSGL